MLALAAMRFSAQGIPPFPGSLYLRCSLRRTILKIPLVVIYFTTLKHDLRWEGSWKVAATVDVVLIAYAVGN